MLGIYQAIREFIHPTPRPSPIDPLDCCYVTRQIVNGAKVIQLKSTDGISPGKRLRVTTLREWRDTGVDTTKRDC